MRSLIARLILVGIAGIAYAGCSSSGSGQPQGQGGGSVPVTLPTSSATAPPFTVAPLLLDNGTEVNPATPAPPANTPPPAFVYKQILTNGPESSETQSSLNSTQDPLPAGAPLSAPTNPPEPGLDDPGSHLITFSGSGSQQVILQLQKTIPDLVYQHNSGVPGQTAGFVTYPYLVLHLAYAPSTTAPVLPALASVSVDITGSQTNAGAFDVRLNCSGTPGSGTSFAQLVCPGTKTIPALGSTANTAGPNPVIPGASAAFDPVAAFAPHIAIVLNFNAPTDAGSLGNSLYVDNVYVAQQQPGTTGAAALRR
jgi:hypothetical protein